MLRPLTGLGDTPTRSRLLAALRRLYLMNLGLLALPGLLIGVPLALFTPAWASLPALLGLSAAGVLCAVLALALAQQKMKAATSGTPEGRDLAMSAAIQAASAPAAPLLMACTTLKEPLSLLALLTLTLLSGLMGWLLLRLWAGKVGLEEQGGVPTKGSPRFDGLAAASSERE
ncbi:hypothetical protein MF271_11880 [Deinococcus sp. KNUC1210]|uniref:hypothetical protein n=1 Tax=Deinococcus sp. KNUC1210 TaxID=2917691 RepID=UPI001EF070C3|nr:hypothetical protein [Deinococcus sp. KNUC1210]ULH14700.1 hypothetical protein MF271_11880 [Deinococcus sp. KNUC1210]